MLNNIRTATSDDQETYNKFDDSRAGLMKLNTNEFAKQNCWAPVDKIESKIHMKGNKDNSAVIHRIQ